MHFLGSDGQTDRHTHTRQNLYILAMRAVTNQCHDGIITLLPASNSSFYLQLYLSGRSRMTVITQTLSGQLQSPVNHIKQHRHRCRCVHIEKYTDTCHRIKITTDTADHAHGSQCVSQRNLI